MARLEGEQSQLEALAAQTLGRTTEIELEIIRIEQEFRTEVSQDLRETTAKQGELAEREIAASDELRYLRIVAPESGIVHQLVLHTVGGVVNPAESIMLIVPSGDRLAVDARVAPKDIDQVLRSDQTARIRFSAFDQRSTPEVTGHIETVAADLAQDEHSGEHYYTARITISQEESEKLDDDRLVPGMPAEVHINTGERTAMSFLLKPLLDQIARAFRER